jgi:hypothetical protein
MFKSPKPSCPNHALDTIEKPSPFDTIGKPLMRMGALSNFTLFQPYVARVIEYCATLSTNNQQNQNFLFWGGRGQALGIARKPLMSEISFGVDFTISTPKVCRY